ncbi:MAG: malto-oligosyltrehalose synthase [Rubrobacteraceae bacterium]
MRVPRATYRLQFNAGFTFRDATDLVPYLTELGVGDLYASPYMKARPGSTHGYDITDHNALNPEIGTEKEHEAMISTLHEHGMGHILDVVPNHMGAGSDNAWWLDMLENGPASAYARFFDVDWSPTNRHGLWGKVLLPILGDHYRAILEGGELKLSFDAEEGSFSVSYYEHRLPLDPRTYPMVFADLPAPPDDERMLELWTLADAFGNLPERGAEHGEAAGVRERDAAIYRRWLARLCREVPVAARAIEERVRFLNGEKGEADGYESLHEILEKQAYRLTYWRVASDEINYRRFFAINDLAGIRVEDERVFDATHRLILSLVKTGKVDGLRIDHPDGLYDPAGYFHRLQASAGGVASGLKEPVYVLVEKILAHHESLPDDWPVAGTTGYDFTNLMNGLFVDAEGESAIDLAYRRFLGSSVDFEEILYECKRIIMREDLASELAVLSRRLLRISEGFKDGAGHARRSHDFTINGLRDALSEVVAFFPVYRTYITPGNVSETDRRHVEWAVARARKHSNVADKGIFDFLRDVLLLESDGPEEYRTSAAAFVMKFQQYTGPVMAKGMEDTALYRYNRLTSLNEVGGEPERFGTTVPAFHHLNGERAKRWPHAMLATSTHDTKRGEDVRARINVLSEIPGEWRGKLVRWGRMNRSRRREVDGTPAPSRNDEYLLYQTLLGAWPLDEGDAGEEFGRRIKAYMEKAMRETRIHTSWTNVNDEYEQAVAYFVDAILAPADTSAENDLFLEDFLPFQRRIARLGALNSLSQTLIKLTAPGVPDIYQGKELWDLSLVDPDNRRPVDYKLRRKLLSELKRMEPANARSLLENGKWQNGSPKLYLMWKALEFRRGMRHLFEDGEYLPLEVEGEKLDHAVALARRSGKETAIMVVPRLCAGLVNGSGSLFLQPETWGNTRLKLPEGMEAPLRNVLTGESPEPEEHDGKPGLHVGELLRNFPAALLVASDL